ncbi:tRNA threonylcarbamoyladenosine biosynthesis protein TsaB [Spiroplasma sp. TIUS-1]|uniref:tRNA (adenosine(37)-N6)-threonylcarbamoyltransferase complex dimerization subunit type 1 TsaB n=1 Tax=Spiroplasma sp. TIUS-1 TaxID=216963 RepID=UPI0013993E26|nr:tRNA (adenosine(37)-N6)-threonylcarbamoyltransferase complex dimerization subunit type 1 TsaB [Spiroplasma sp. TIUS-1]QHX35710.1 tRNA threonylcarbamoyladenosine biosynthesis protein TsaB [Spiroplasma sp. TIUS-1]
MKSLFIDTTNNKIVFIYLHDNKLIDSIVVDAKNKISEIFDDELKMFLAKQKTELNEISEFYVTKGPGTFTGVRIGLSIVKTIWTINKDIKVYSINTMQLMAGKSKVSVAIDARGGKHFFASNTNGIIANNLEIVLNEKLPKENIITNLDNIDYVKNFSEVRDKFILETDINNFNPIYIKNAI